MRKLLIIIFLFLTIPAYSQTEYLESFSENNLPVLNDTLENTDRRLYDVEQPRDLTIDVEGILPLGNGGLGADFNGISTGDMFIGHSGTVGIVGIGTSGYVWQSDGTTADWGDITDSKSNVLFSWFGSDTKYKYTGTSQNPITGSEHYDFFTVFDTSYVTILNFKFKKIDSIDTVTIWARLWGNDANSDVYLEVDINSGTKNEVLRESGTPGWVSANINVSGLTDGTTYDATIKLKDDAVVSRAKCSAIMLIGS